MVNRAAFLDAENVHAQRTLEEILLSLDRIRVVAQIWYAGVGARKLVTVNITRHSIRRIEKVSAKIRRFLQRHVTASAVCFGFIRLIKTARAMAGHATKQISVVMILAPEKFLIMIQLARNADLMTGRAKLGRAHEWFEK